MMESTIREKVEIPLPIDNVIPISYRRKIDVYVLICKELFVRSNIPQQQYYVIDVEIDKKHLPLIMDHQVGPVYSLAIDMALKNINSRVG